MKINFNKETVTFEMFLPGLFCQIKVYKVALISLFHFGKLVRIFILYLENRANK